MTKGSIYIDLIRLYWDCQAHFGLTNGATALYFYILHKFNQARWPNKLGISSLEIGGVLGISKPTLLKFKDELSNTGLIECHFMTGKIRQEYTLKHPTLTFGGVDFEALDDKDGKEDSKEDSKQHSQNSLPTYIYNTNTEYIPPIVPQKGDNKERDKQALEVYEAYPRKVGRPKALLAIKRHIEKVGFETLLERTNAYAKSVIGKDQQFIPHPSTWYSQERFNDDPSTWTQGSGSSPGNRSELVASGPQRVMMLQERQKALKQEMHDYRNQHLSVAAMTSTWDAGTKERYQEMAAKLKEIQSKLDEAL